MHVIGFEVIGEEAVLERGGSVFEQDFGSGFVGQAGVQLEAGLDGLAGGAGGEEIGVALVDFQEGADGGMSQAVGGRAAADGRRFQLGRRRFGEHVAQLVQLGGDGGDVVPGLRGVGDAVVVLEAAVGVPGDAVGAVDDGQEAHGPQFGEGREALPAGPALEVLDDGPDGFDRVALGGEVGVDQLHVADDLGGAVGVGVADGVDFGQESVGGVDVGQVVRGIGRADPVGLDGQVAGVEVADGLVQFGQGLRRDVGAGVVGQVPGQDGGMLVFAGDRAQIIADLGGIGARARRDPDLEAVFGGGGQKFLEVLVAGGLVGMGEVEAGLFEVGEGLVEAVVVAFAFADGIGADGEERFAVDQDKAVVA